MSFDDFEPLEILFEYAMKRSLLVRSGFVWKNSFMMADFQPLQVHLFFQVPLLSSAL